jgi:hypothetical protein
MNYNNNQKESFITNIEKHKIYYKNQNLYKPDNEYVGYKTTAYKIYMKWYDYYKIFNDKFINDINILKILYCIITNSGKHKNEIYNFDICKNISIYNNLNIKDENQEYIIVIYIRNDILRIKNYYFEKGKLKLGNIICYNNVYKIYENKIDKFVELCDEIYNDKIIHENWINKMKKIEI